jgi:hypothetical protein
MRSPVSVPLPNIFAQAENALKRGLYDASGAMSRKTVDVATKLLIKEVAKQVRDLAPRIDALAKHGKLTEDPGSGRIRSAWMATMPPMCLAHRSSRCGFSTRPPIGPKPSTWCSFGS